MTQTLNGGPGNDFLTGTDPGDPTNPDGIDIINGGGSVDVLKGLGGDDIIEGGADSDQMDGGAGFDTLSYAHATSSVVVYLGLGGLGGEAFGDMISNFEALIGSAFTDQLAGDAGANSIDGGAGDDVIVISGGADKMDGGDGKDYVDGTSATSAIDVNLTTGVGQGWAAGCTFSGFEVVFGSLFNDTLTANLNLDTMLTGENGNDTLNGGNGDDTLAGDVVFSRFRSGGTDTLNGGAGDDTLSGGELGDVLNGGFGIDTAVYSSSSAAVTINLAFGTASGGDADGDTLTSIENVTGSSFNDVLASSTAANTLDGGNGTDQVTYAFSGAAVSINLATNANTGSDAQGDTLLAVENVTGSAFGDTLVGNTAVNVLDGGDGNDVLDGAAGADTLDGGAGSDTATYAQSNAAVTIDLIFGANTGGHAQGDVLQGIENLVGSAFGDTLIGDLGDNVIDGGAGDDLIVGYDGADTINGGAGIDMIYYYNAAVIVNLAAGIGTDGDAQGDTYQNVENVVGSAFNDTLIGNGGANALYGDDGDDGLTGHGGADVIDGGHGIDTAYYDASAAGVVVSLATGIGSGGDAEGDTVSNIENVTGSSFADALTGGGGANALTGGAGNDELYGGAGADVLDGGSGTDAAGYFSSGAAVTVDLAAGTGTGGDAQGDVLSNIENLGGSIYDDHLTGNAGINGINGGGGNDSIAGAAGSDALYGGNGNDQIDGGADGDGLSGAAGTDTLAGGAGNDAINGGADADAIDGGAGIDIADYNGSDIGVTVNLATNINTGGYAQGDTLTNIENLQGSAFGDTLTGDGAANTLSGMAGNDGLNGGAGWDTLEGGNGDDQLVGGAGGDLLRGGAGADHLTGGADYDTASYWDSTAGVIINLQTGINTGGTAQGDTIASDIETINGSNHNDVMTGNAQANELVGFDGADTLSGGGGADTLRGGSGADTLNGGAGSDYFSYIAVSDSTAAAADTIQDFQAGDLISLRLIDADGNSGNGDTAFTFIGAGAFSGTAGQLRCEIAGGTTTVSADVDGDSVADIVIRLTGAITLQASDLLL